MTTEKSVLAELMYCPFVQELVEYRNAAHAKSNFFSKIEEYIVKTDKGYDIVYFSFNQCGTKTGRFSGGGEGGVNGQQTSAGGKKSIGSSSYSSQKMFGPRPGYIFLDFDYSQQEARLFALLANVPIMLDAMKARVDPFRAMANKAWSGQGNPNSINAGILALELYKDKPSNTEIKELWDFYKWNKKIALNTSPKDTIISEIVDDWLSQFNYDIVEAEEALHKELSRQRSKHITYAKIFGGSAGSFAHLLLCDLATAKIFNDSFDAEIPQFKNYIQELSKQAKRDGYILNLYGRKLRVEYNFAYRAVSYKIQGTAADMMKTSLIKVHEYNKSIKADANIIMTIHDAMKIEILKRDYNVGYVRGVASRMENTDGIVGIHIPVECTYTDKAWSVEEKKIDIW
jgi:DNA polymerase I-like protein with 3'-5' exonuclease and polymerase domains